MSGAKHLRIWAMGEQVQQQTAQCLVQRAGSAPGAKDPGGEHPKIHSTLQSLLRQSTQSEMRLTICRPKHPIELARLTKFIVGLPECQDPSQGKGPSGGMHPHLGCREQRCRRSASPRVQDIIPIMAGAPTCISNTKDVGTLHSGQMAVQKYLT